MNISIGIVGLPNVGKSTLFNALLKKQSSFAEASAGQAGSGIARVGNYPFTTIEPNVGIVPVPDGRLQKLQGIVRASTPGVEPPIVPAIVKFIDIAGLVKGAAEGEGLGNKFLSHVRETDLICHVIRYFKDTNVTHVSGEPKPQEDRDTIETELILADLETLNRQQEPRKNATKEDLIRWQAIIKLRKELNTGVLAKDVVLTNEEKELVKDLNLITGKPAFFIANVSENDLKNKFPENTIAVSAKTEAELAELPEDEQKEYLESLGLLQSGLEKVIEKGYEMLGLISFLTAGEKEVRAWTIKKGTNAVDAASVIHTDFSKKFIKAEAVSFDDFVSSGGWKKSRELGKTRFEGRDYIIKDGDVVEFKIGS